MVEPSCRRLELDFAGSRWGVVLFQMEIRHETIEGIGESTDFRVRVSFLARPRGPANLGISPEVMICIVVTHSG